MALYTRSAPVGIDIPIAAFQQFLYSQVKLAWNISDDFKYACYDRAYRDLIDKGYVPRSMIPNSQGVLEYATINFDPETNWAVSFFSVADQTKIIMNRTSSSQMALIFGVNLGTADHPTIKPTVLDHRPDEEVRNDIERICYTPRFDFQINSIDTGYEYVFRDYKGMIDRDKTQYRDWQPLRVFRINMELQYALEDCYQPVQNSF